jgi:Na+/alanine symporter
MKYYLLKLFYLLSVYLIIFLFLFFYSLISNYFYSNKKNNEFIFLQKLYENKTYYLKDFILDAPFILN